MTDAPPSKLITAVLPVETDTASVVRRLKSEKSIVTADVHFGRGIGRTARPRGRRRVGIPSEKAILTVLVDADRADEIFRFIFDAADIDRPHGGIIYAQPLSRATVYELPDAPDETD